MTQGNTPKNKNPKPGGSQGQPSGNKSSGSRSTGEQRKPTTNVERTFTSKSRVRSGGARAVQSDNPKTSGAGGGGSFRDAAERKQERQKEQQRRRLTVTGIVIGAVVLLALVTLLIVNVPADAPLPDYIATRYEGLQQTITQEGYPQLGSPNAPVRVAVYSSFDCSACREFHDGYQQQMVDRVRAGGMSLIFVPLYGTGSVTNGEGAARASMCALQQNNFWAFQDALFNWQGLYVNQAFTNNRIQTGANQLGVSVNAGCINSDQTSRVLTTARTAANNLLNFAGTPTITINGVVPTDGSQNAITDRTALMNAIDAEIARLGGASVTPDATDEPAPAVEATEAAAPAVEVTPEATAEAAAEAEATPEATPAS